MAPEGQLFTQTLNKQRAAYSAIPLTGGDSRNRVGTANTAPAMIPFTAKILDGTNGSSTGVTKRPEKTPVAQLLFPFYGGKRNDSKKQQKNSRNRRV